ncbi:hypothetical protein ACTMTI_53945 [Nonomuraea sp. H19]
MKFLIGLANVRLEFLLIEALHDEAERLAGEGARSSGVRSSRPGDYWYA